MDQQPALFASLSFQSSALVGAVGAFDRSGSVFAYDQNTQENSLNVSQFLSQEDLNKLLGVSDISEFRDSYLGKIFFLKNLLCVQKLADFYP